MSFELGQLSLFFPTKKTRIPRLTPIQDPEAKRSSRCQALGVTCTRQISTPGIVRSRASALGPGRGRRGSSTRSLALGPTKNTRAYKMPRSPALPGAAHFFLNFLEARHVADVRDVG